MQETECNYPSHMTDPANTQLVRVQLISVSEVLNAILGGSGTGNLKSYLTHPFGSWDIRETKHCFAFTPPELPVWPCVRVNVLHSQIHVGPIAMLRDTCYPALVSHRAVRKLKAVDDGMKTVSLDG